ncbi:MAG TPA: hypothetical protein VHZ99_09705 [Steroidobacteraceae bacterium]|jgi:hypothetical protein|nr:hypothetical protein [Steroidobacteraceae bacterium]
MSDSIDTLDGQGIATIALGEISGHATYGGNADAGLLMNLAVGQAAPKTLDHRPPIGHRLQLGGRAQIAQKRATLVHAAKRKHGRHEIALGQGFLPRGESAV